MSRREMLIELGQAALAFVVAIIAGVRLACGPPLVYGPP
jgi:hypothetical protein